MVRSKFMVVLAAFSMVLSTDYAVAQSAQPPSTGGSTIRSHIDFQYHSVLDLHYSVLASVAKHSHDQATDPDFDRAVHVAMAFETASGLRGRLLWGMLDDLIIHVNSTADLLSHFKGLPEERKKPDGTSFKLRENAVRYAEALVAADAAFLKTEWPKHKAMIRSAQDLLEKEFIPKLPECMADVFEKLEIRDPGYRLPFYLVAKAPFPGASTSKRPNDEAMCILAVESFQGSVLFEAILHEFMHAIDQVCWDQDHAFNQLRMKLNAAKITPDQKVHRDAVHAVFFVQAGETIRRLINPNHQHYGETALFYKHLDDGAATVLTHWMLYLEKYNDLPTTINSIVTDVLNPPKKL